MSATQQSELLPELGLRSFEFHSRLANQDDVVSASLETLQEN